ncbi:unnamed protein product [Schistosoma haematobium]|nr:unnamed protein product [Schistosoma haematobium]
MLSGDDNKHNSKELYPNELQCKGCNHQIHDKILIYLIKKDQLLNDINQKSINEQNQYKKQLKLSSNLLNSNFKKLNYYFNELNHMNQSIEIYHINCFNCYECGNCLTLNNNERCWIYQENKIICMNCRIRYKHCGRCRLQVPEDMKVHKLNRVPFHTTCFTCFQCGRQLHQGDKCGIFNNDVLCYEHYMTKFLSWKVLNLDTDSITNMNQIEPRQMDKLQQFPYDQENFSINMNETKIDRNFNQDHIHLPNNRHKADRITMMNANCSTSSTSLSFNQSSEITESFLTSSNYPTLNNLQSISNISSTTTAKFTSVNSIENCQTTDNWCSIDESMLNEEILLSNGDISMTLTENGHSIDSSTSSNCSVHSKSKRIRTSFTPDQLAILQANFDIEANPDGQELERIAGMAKLNKRVTQVWFQNARARKKKIECRGTLEGQHDQIGFNNLTCCLADSMGIEEFYDNSKENIPSMNSMGEGLLSTNDDGMNSNQIYEREYNCKSDCFNELNHIANNDKNISNENKMGKNLSHFHFRSDPVFINDNNLTSNGNESNFSKSNNTIEHDFIMNRLFSNPNSFGKIPFSSTNGHCVSLSDTTPRECDRLERMNPMKDSSVTKNDVATIGMNNHGVQINNTTSINVSTEDVVTFENMNESIRPQNSTPSARCTVRPNLFTDQNMVDIIPPNYRLSNNFYFPAIALPTN